MRTMNLFAIAVLAALSLPAAAEAQNNAVLNTIEVRQLASRSNPADHQRLAAHFNALADQYARESQRHASMIHSDGNPSRNPALGNSPHCHHLAEVNRESAAAARELGAHHLNLAKGSSSIVPADAVRFERGDGARAATSEEIEALSAEARSTADHRAIEEYFRALAGRYTSQANEHVALAQTYRGTRLAAAAVHQDRLAALARASAAEAATAAAQHKQMADSAR
jgi:hypothetical protein